PRALRLPWARPRRDARSLRRKRPGAIPSRDWPHGRGLKGRRPPRGPASIADQAFRLPNRGIAEAVRGAVAALKPDLVRAVALGELDIEAFVERQTTVRADIGLHHRRRNAPGIELVVPGRVQRVRPVDALAVAADLHHLRTSLEGLPVGMIRLPDDPAQMEGAREPGVHWVADVILAQFADAPAGDV